MAHAAAAMAARGGRRFGSGPRFRSSYEDDYEDGPNMCWVAIFCVSGVALVITGAVYMQSSFSDPRADTIKTYNNYVDYWTDAGRPHFEQTQWTYRVVSPVSREVEVRIANCTKTAANNCMKKEIQLAEVPSSDADAVTVAWKSLKADHNNETLDRNQYLQDIHQYSPLKFLDHGFLPKNPVGEFEDYKFNGPKYTIQIKGEVGGKSKTWELEPMVLMKDVVVGANQKMCRLHHGNNFHSGQCWDRLALHHICVQFNYTNGEWSSKPNPAGGFGCEGLQEARYARSCPSKGLHHLSQHHQSCDFSPVNLTLRSADDPHIKALIMTAGTLNFGSTPKENWQSGIIMLVVGCIMLCPAVPSIFFKWSSSRSKYSSYMYEDRFDMALRPASRNYRDSDEDSENCDVGIAVHPGPQDSSNAYTRKVGPAQMSDDRV
mmetsp:Transcript_21779/g.34130  ORF Transcript_21779/g.34130 Transcript_21779/m.34130 type:complete len:432 (-) Transcript_21779:241-1536(-)